jgi:carbamoyl-phosphate synthase large subunit
MKVLVTAAGSPLGQSVTKALLLSPLKPNVHIADSTQAAAGLHLFSELKSCLTPGVMDPQYDDFITSKLVSEKIDVVFPLLGVEFAYFQKNSTKFKGLGIEVVAPRSHDALRAESKFESIELVKKAGLNYPQTSLISSQDDIFRFFEEGNAQGVLKPVFGASSAEIHFVNTPTEASAIIQLRPPGYFVLQEFMPGAEFTVGVHRSVNSDSAYSIAIERDLKFGLSYSGKVIFNDKIEQYAIDVVLALGLYDSNNVQLKLVNDQPVMFEINPRLSSTTSVRAHFGFNEPDMILKDRLLKEKINHPTILQGNFSRYWEEVYW